MKYLQIIMIIFLMILIMIMIITMIMILKKWNLKIHLIKKKYMQDKHYICCYIHLIKRENVLVKKIIAGNLKQLLQGQWIQSIKKIKNIQLEKPIVKVNLNVIMNIKQSQMKMKININMLEIM